MDSMQQAQQPREDHRLAFFRNFLQKPKEVGSVIPSSRFLEKQIVRAAEFDKAKVVVELGPGTGGTTKAFLRQLGPDTKLLAIEINSHFVELLGETIPDDRLLVHEGSATEIEKALAQYELPAPDVILSGIPFSTMPRTLGLDILHSVKRNLAPGGRFVAYQFRDRVEQLGRQVFGPGRAKLELRNVPPMRVYRWEQGSDGV